MAFRQETRHIAGNYPAYRHIADFRSAVPGVTIP